MLTVDRTVHLNADGILQPDRVTDDDRDALKRVDCSRLGCDPWGRVRARFPLWLGPATSAEALAGDRLGRDSLDVRRETEPLERGDEPGREIELPAIEAMRGRARE